MKKKDKKQLIAALALQKLQQAKAADLRETRHKDLGVVLGAQSLILGDQKSLMMRAQAQKMEQKRKFLLANSEIFEPQIEQKQQRPVHRVQDNEITKIKKIPRRLSFNEEIVTLGNGTRKKVPKKQKQSQNYEDNYRDQFAAQRRLSNKQELAGSRRRGKSSGGIKILKRMGKIGAYSGGLMGLISLAAGEASAKIITFIDLI